MVHITVSKKMLVAAMAFLLLLIPAAAYAGSLFGDVDDGSTHFVGIKYMKDTGITLGCGDGSNFCPKDPVTREQMATFLHRMSGNAAGTPANVNAAALDGAPPEVYMAPVAGSATVASLLIDADVDAKLVELEVTAPLDGWFFVVGKASYDDSENTRILQWVQVDNSTCANVPAQTESVDAAYTSTSATATLGTATSAGLVSVPAGTHTLTLCAREFGSGTGTLVRYPALTAMFSAVGG